MADDLAGETVVVPLSGRTPDAAKLRPVLDGE